MVVFKEPGGMFKLVGGYTSTAVSDEIESLLGFSVLLDICD